MLREQQMEFFLETARSHSFSATARHFGVSRQAVNKSVVAVETHFGVKLFLRGTQELTLTAAGELVADFFEHTLEQYRLLTGRLCVEDNRKSVFRIGFHDNLSMDTAILPTLRASGFLEHDQMDISAEHCSLPVLLEALEAQQLDAVVMCERLLTDDSRFHFCKIMELPLVLMVSDDWPANAEDDLFEELRRRPLIVNRFEQESQQDFVRRTQLLAAFCGLSPAKIIQVPNRDTAFMAVKMGRGVLMSAATSRYASAYNIRTCPLEARDTLVCLWRKEDPDPLPGKYAKWISTHGGGG